jgi:predicted nuclease of predicted toxin-antitoxin system
LKFKIDENLPAEFALRLREAGFEADTAAEEGLSGAGDTRIMQSCRDQDRILMTLDLDFASIRAYPPRTHPGIIVLRPRSQDVHALTGILRRLLPVLQDRSPAGELWIVEFGRIRTRGR